MTSKRGPESLPEDIYGLLDDDTDHVVSEENVDWAGEVFKDLLRTRLRKRDPKALRFSNLGKKDRQLWYIEHMPEKAEKLPGKTKLKFFIGDVWEVILLFLAKESGHDVTDTQLEVNEDGVSGHIDAKIDGVLVDVKSASPFTFEKFKSSGYLFDDPFGYISQLAGYAHETGCEEAGWLVGNKVDGEVAYVPLSKQDIAASPPGERIAEIRRVLADETPPPRCYPDQPEGKSGNRKLGIGCSYCPFKDECWQDANGGQGLRKYIYARGPVWLTHVAKEPRVEEA